jgi:hypothetical protein
MIVPPNLLKNAPPSAEIAYGRAVGCPSLRRPDRRRLDAEFTEPWSVSGKVAPGLFQPYIIEPEYVVGFHYVVEGAFLLTLDNGSCWHIRTGELVMLPRNDLHILGSAGGLVSIGVGALMHTRGVTGMARIVHGGGGPRTRMVCAFLGGNPLLLLD